MDAPKLDTTRAVARPFLKWVGGKRQLLDDLEPFIPDDFTTYHEPFVGGGAVFFHLHAIRRLAGKHVILSDVNQELIDTWTALRDDCEAVIKSLHNHRYEKDWYYQVRAQNPEDLPLAERAARMIYLNKTSFNGLYRVNSNGKFNVPIGRYANPTICDEDNLRAVSIALEGVALRCQPFDSVVAQAHPGAFVYFDPPYVPLSDTSHFTAYAKAGFSHEQQERLAVVFEELAKRQVTAVLSNSSADWVRKRYAKFNPVLVDARRNVNSKASKRFAVKEVIVSNVT